MKYILLSIALLTFCLFLPGCESCDKQIKHMKSGISGLNRTVTVYDYEGGQIKKWSGKFMVERTGNGFAWIDNNDKEIKVSGGIVIIEEN